MTNATKPKEFKLIDCYIRKKGMYENRYNSEFYVIERHSVILYLPI
jgi:hypothetical protein